MREIKFRAWDKVKGVMIYEDSEDNDFLIGLDGNVGSYDDDDGGKIGLHEHWYKADVELMQFTGLKDKNGKEIYEGDIVKSNLIGENRLSWVNFWDGCFTVEGSGLAALAYKIFGWEIIGNIYEHSNLLDKQNGV